MSSAATTTAQPIFHPPGAGQSFDVLGDAVSVKATAAQTNGQITVFITHTSPGGGPPLHLHTFEDELFFILEGEYQFQVAGRRIKAPAGSFLYAPKGVPHTFANLTSAPAKMLVFTIPGRFDQFFADVDASTKAGAMNDAEAMRLIQAYGMSVLGPPLAAIGSATAQ